MNKIKYIIVLFVGLLGMVSCSEDDGVTTTEFDNWQARNDIYFEECYERFQDSVAMDSSTYKIIKAVSKNQSTTGEHTDYILVKVLKKGAGTVSPYSNDTVRVDYRGWLMPSESLPGGYQFDSSWYGDYDESTMTPYKAGCGSFVTGFNTALQHMHVGDRWFIIIPYKLAYDDTESTTIPAYSTLRFDVTLRSFMRAGHQMPDFQ